MEKNRTVLMVVLSTTMLFAGCNNRAETVEVKQESAKKLDLESGVKLVQLISSSSIHVKDIWGEYIKTDKFYAYTKSMQLIPLVHKRNPLIPGTNMSIEEYVSGLEAYGKHPDTVKLSFPSLQPSIWPNFKVYPTGEITLDAMLN